jgi:lysozyme-like protein
VIPALIGIGVVVAILYFSQGAQADTICGACSLQSVYSYSELIYLASQAGFGADSSTAAAVALAESGGSRTALGDAALAPSNGPAVGLWQINTGKHKEYTPDELLDAQTNADEAYKIYSDAGGSFSPWTTYNSGAYESFLQ